MSYLVGIGICLSPLIILGIFIIKKFWFNDKKRFAANRKKKLIVREKCLLKLRSTLDSKSITDENIDHITQIPFLELIDLLKNDKIDASDVLKAYQIKAIRIHDETNCITEPISEAAVPVKKYGSFYGIPISVKDNFDIKGYDSTLGCSKFLFKPKRQNAVLIDFLMNNGAIPFVKTNVPQTLMSWETNNPIFGPTTVPGFPDRNSGGSSGGEACLVKGGGSILGIGSDIGGSLRIPAHMNGVTTLKPSPNRIGNGNVSSVLKGQALIQACYGPIARDVDTLTYFFRNVLVDEYFNMESSVVPMKFNEDDFNSKRKLRIGYYDSLDYCRSFPVVRRAVNIAKEHLIKQGHELIPYKLPSAEKAMELYLLSVNGDGGRTIKDALKDDEINSAIKMSALINSYSITFRKIFGKLFMAFVTDIGKIILQSCGVGSCYDWWKHTAIVHDLRRQIYNDWNSKNIDALLTPGFPVTAAKIGTYNLGAPGTIYTAYFNLIAFVAGSQPVTTVTKKDEADVKNYMANKPWEHVLKNDCLSGTVGLPCNVQIVTKPFREELCLRIMKELEDSLKNI